MIAAVGGTNPLHNTAPAILQAPANGKQGAEELTTVTTHCDKNHKHTPACPHTTSTQPAGPAAGSGWYIDVYA